MIKIITKKRYKKLIKENEFFSKGWRAMTRVLDYQRAIIAILETLGISEIEIDDKLLYTNQKEIEVQQTHNHTTKIRIK